MTHAGIAVPEGFVVTSDGYREFLKENALEEMIHEELVQAGSDETRVRYSDKEDRFKFLYKKLLKR